MARKTQTPTRIEDARHVLVAVGLAGGALGTLALGAALRVDPGAASAATEAPPAARVAPAEPSAALPPPDPLPGEYPTDSALDFAPDEAEEPQPGFDEPPAATAAAEWTLQFMVTCKADVVARIGRELEGDDWLLVTEHTVGNARCHRISWGRFATADEARSARLEAPAPLVELTSAPLARRLSELLP